MLITIHGRDLLGINILCGSIKECLHNSGINSTSLDLHDLMTSRDILLSARNILSYPGIQSIKLIERSSLKPSFIEQESAERIALLNEMKSISDVFIRVDKSEPQGFSIKKNCFGSLTLDSDLPDGLKKAVETGDIHGMLRKA